MQIPVEFLIASLLLSVVSLVLSLILSGLWEATRESFSLRRKLFYFVVLQGLFFGVLLAGEIVLHSHAQYSNVRTERPCYGPCPEADWPRLPLPPSSAIEQSKPPEWPKGNNPEPPPIPEEWKAERK